MTITELKEYIYKENKIEYVLQEIGNHHIQYHANKEFWSCANYNGDNVSAVNVRNNKYLDVKNWTRESDFPEESDLITLVQYNKQLSFVNAIKYLHNLLGLQYSYKKQTQKKEEKFNPLEVFHKIQRSKKRVNVEDIHVLDEDILDNYIPLLHLSWVREGITERARNKFGIAYSFKRNRIMIPHRWWLTGELLGFNARTALDNYEEFGVKKYYISEGMNKALNLYGLYENREEIEKVGYVTVFESEKSVLKRCSLFDDSGVALSGHSLSEEQRRILLSLNVKEIVISLDKDININEVRHMCEQFYLIKPVSYIYDKYDLLKGSKDSPADAHNKVYQFLFKNRVKYDEKEHNEYLNSLKKR